MKDMTKLKDALCRNLDELAEAGLTTQTLAQIHQLSDTLKNILKIEMLEQAGEGKYSNRSYGNSYDGGYNNGGYSNRHYDRYDGNSYGRYSYADGKTYIISELENIMNRSGNESDRMAIRRCIDEMHRA